MSKDLMQVIKKSDIQEIDRMLAEVGSANYDPVKHKAKLDLLKIKRGFSKDGIFALKEFNIKDKNDIERDRLTLDRDKFEFKKEQANKKALIINPVEKDEDEYFLRDIFNIKIQIRQFNQQEYPDNLVRQKTTMPTPEQLKADPKYAPVVQAIDNFHGGFERVAELFGLQYQAGTL